MDAEIQESRETPEQSEPREEPETIETPEEQESPETEETLEDEVCDQDREIELTPVVESLIFSAQEPLSVNRIARILENVPAKTIRNIISGLIVKYGESAHGIQIIEIAGGCQMATKPEFSSYVLKLDRQKKRSPLSTPALETLAIIAYKQPITRAEIESIRGVDSSGMIHNLSELNLIKVVGKKEVVGRPPLYGTSEDFLKAFGLSRLSDLPSIRELREKFSQTQEREESGKE